MSPESPNEEWQPDRSPEPLSALSTMCPLNTSGDTPALRHRLEINKNLSTKAYLTQI